MELVDGVGGSKSTSALVWRTGGYALGSKSSSAPVRKWMGLVGSKEPFAFV
jgi:hypothetical protein